jgi:predicted transposase YbfD/YdcC
MLEALISQFAQIEDPRCDWRVEHKLIDVLVIAVCAVIGEAESFEDIALYGRCKRDWLQRFLALPNGIPSHDTFRRVLMLIDPERFERCFLDWVRSVFRVDAGAPRQIAIDGKSVRRSFDRRSDRSPLHLVSAFAVEHGLVLAQRATDPKRGELTVLPDLLDGLDLRGCLVSLDALACQPEIAAQITGRGGDYLLALKSNQKKAHAEVKLWFEANARGIRAPVERAQAQRPRRHSAGEGGAVPRHGGAHLPDQDGARFGPNHSCSGVSHDTDHCIHRHRDDRERARPPDGRGRDRPRAQQLTRSRQPRQVRRGTRAARHRGNDKGGGHEG